MFELKVKTLFRKEEIEKFIRVAFGNVLKKILKLKLLKKNHNLDLNK